VAPIAVALAGISASAQPQPTPPVEERVDATIARQMAARQIPGLSLGVVRDGALVLAKGYGEVSVEWKAPATPDTVYLLASVTKQFTAAAIMTLVRDGKVRLDDSIATYVAAPPAWSGITIRHLLSHTAGLEDRFEHTAEGRMFLDYSTAQMLEAATHTPTDFAPGTGWQYSDQGYFLLGMVVEKASGQRYGDYLKQRLFAPAGLTSTSFHDWRAIVPARADGYALAGGTLIGSRRRYQFELVSHYGVQSTVRDLAKYDAALSAGTLLPRETLAEMWTPVRLAGGGAAGIAGIGYGFGWFLERFRGHREVYHAGSTGACIYHLPDDDVSVILLTNLEQASGSDPCGIARMVAEQYVPAIAVASAPVMDDTDRARTSRLRAALESFAAGTPDPADYTPDTFAVLAPAASAQKAGFDSVGPLSSFELIADDDLVTPVVWYRARFRNATVHFRLSLDASGKITSLQAR
jgi:CubicO group peptidase (beta-lactamase class C family)